MRKIFLRLFIVFFLIQAAGCASFEKKFTRKKKVPDHIPAVVYMEEPSAQKKYPNEYYYKMHFNFWKNWHDEFIKNLGGNIKRVEQCGEEDLSQLVEMNRYLAPAKQAELKPSLDSLGKIVDAIEKGDYSKSRHEMVKEELERIKRRVSGDFYPDKVKGDLAPDSPG